MSAAEFDRRWRAADRWMAVVVPGSADCEERGGRYRPASRAAASHHHRLRSTGGRRRAPCAGQRPRRRRAGAERARLDVRPPCASWRASGCCRRRWPEAADLASAAVEADRADTYAWKVLATSRFVQNDRLGALEAWNQVGEPRVDLVRFDGLTRTRHRAVEQLVHAPAGELLSPGDFVRAATATRRAAVRHEHAAGIHAGSGRTGGAARRRRGAAGDADRTPDAGRDRAFRRGHT